MLKTILPPDDWLGIALRLFLALLAGAVVGWERQSKGKPAGLRTHMLVSLGSALFVLVPIQLGGPEQSADALSRGIQGVATGIGFLGAGEILRESQAGTVKVRGLTSAAAVWISAALGIVVGTGLWITGVLGVLLTWLTLSGVKKLERYASIRNDPDD